MSGGSKLCSLCCEEARSWAVGPCDHPSCLACCARLRILCDQKECPVCRKQVDKVVVSAEVKPFASFSLTGLRGDKRHGILFVSPQLQGDYTALRQSKCSVCEETPVFRSFSLLRDHMRKAHELYYCDLCVDGLKLFPKEFKTYTRSELVRHRRDGDPGDSSYRPHPLCQFCDDWFLDNDTLHAHLRRNHFWCHFCESDGKQEFYSTYPFLRSHFKKDHFLCEEGACRQEQFTSVYRTKIDLKAHRASVHAGGLTKAEVKQLRQVEVGFSYSHSRTREEEPVSRQVTRAKRGRPLREKEELELPKTLSLQTSATASSKKTSSPSEEQKPLVSKELGKPPPGFQHKPKQPEGIKHPPGLVAPPPSSADWPNLNGEVPQTSSLNKRGPLQPPSSVNVHRAPPGFSPNPLPTNTIPNMEDFPPPSLITNRQHGPKYKLVEEDRGRRALEAELVGKVREILGYDRHKMYEFKQLSGWYKNSEITVCDYADRCAALMGEAWQDIGPKLAHVLPDRAKQRELSSLFDLAKSTGNRQKSMQLSVWRSGHGQIGVLDEEEYPTLSVAAHQPAPPPKSNPWVYA